ncbi:hypothetical protein D3C83_72630 [compost metagenome]
MLEDVHGLQQQRLRQAERCDQGGDARLARYRVEYRIEIMKCVADLVERPVDRPVGRFRLEEEADVGG